MRWAFAELAVDDRYVYALPAFASTGSVPYGESLTSTLRDLVDVRRPVTASPAASVCLQNCRKLFALRRVMDIAHEGYAAGVTDSQ